MKVTYTKRPPQTITLGELKVGDVFKYPNGEHIYMYLESLDTVSLLTGVIYPVNDSELSNRVLLLNAYVMVEE